MFSFLFILDLFQVDKNTGRIELFTYTHLAILFIYTRVNIFQDFYILIYILTNQILI